MPFTSTHVGGFAPQSRWSRRFWLDLAERTGATLVGALLTALTVVGSTPVDWSDGQVVWTILGLPTLVAFLKGLAANLGNAETGASLLPTAPPGPDLYPEGEHDGRLDEIGRHRAEDDWGH